MKKRNFKISNKIIWSSSILVGILMSIPKIAEHHFNLYETIVNFILTTLFSLFVWYLLEGDESWIATGRGNPQ